MERQKTQGREEALPTPRGSMQSLSEAAEVALLGPSKPASMPVPPTGRHSALRKTHLYEADETLRGNNRAGAPWLGRFSAQTRARGVG